MKVIAIEGVSGAGKSTFSRKLASVLEGLGKKVIVSEGIQSTKHLNFFTEILRERLQHNRFLRLPWGMETSTLYLEMYERVNLLKEQSAEITLYENYETSMWAYQLARAEEEGVELNEAIEFLERLDALFLVPPPTATICLQPPLDQIPSRLKERAETTAPYEKREADLMNSVNEKYKQLSTNWSPWIEVSTYSEIPQAEVSRIAEQVLEWTLDHRGPLIYLAGPLHTPGERWYLEKLGRKLEKLGARIFLPHKDVGLSDPNEYPTLRFFRADCSAIDKCDLVVAVLDGFTVDSGTAWEIGYAHHRGIRCFGTIDDTRIGNPLTQINLMIVNSCEIVSEETLLSEIRDLTKSDD